MLDVQLVLYEKGWIVEAIARQWLVEFNTTNNARLVYDNPEFGSDIYVHFIYSDAKIVSNSINFVYVTHIDSIKKAYILQQQFSKGVFFITMSIETAKVLGKIVGRNEAEGITVCRPESLHFKRQNNSSELVFGFFSRNYKDGRKNEELLVKIVKTISKASGAKLLIYGSGWKNIKELEGNKNVVIIEEEFSLAEYTRCLERCNYVLYLSKDEGAISILDASTLGIPTITFPVGFHAELQLAPTSILVETNEEFIYIVKTLVNSFDLKLTENVSISECKELILSKGIIRDQSGNKPSIWRIINYSDISFRTVKESVGILFYYSFKKIKSIINSKKRK